jgi:hypothetical protein
MSINDQYKQLTKSRINSTRNVAVQSFVPFPTEADIKRGYIRRFFVQKVNDQNAPIIEVHNTNFIKISQSGIYNTASMKWRITGPIESLFDNDIVIDVGVKYSNTKSIQINKGKIKKLEMYLPNLIQFHSKKK